MPDTTSQWLWFTFFGLGSMGGVLFLISLVVDLLTTVRDSQDVARMK